MDQTCAAYSRCCHRRHCLDIQLYMCVCVYARATAFSYLFLWMTIKMPLTTCVCYGLKWSGLMTLVVVIGGSKSNGFSSILPPRGPQSKFIWSLFSNPDCDLVIFFRTDYPSIQWKNVCPRLSNNIIYHIYILVYSISDRRADTLIL